MPFPANFSIKWPPHSYLRTSYPSALKMYVCLSCWASGVPHSTHCSGTRTTMCNLPPEEAFAKKKGILKCKMWGFLF